MRTRVLACKHIDLHVRVAFARSCAVCASARVGRAGSGGGIASHTARTAASLAPGECCAASAAARTAARLAPASCASAAARAAARGAAARPRDSPQGVPADAWGEAARLGWRQLAMLKSF